APQAPGAGHFINGACTCRFGGCKPVHVQLRRNGRLAGSGPHSCAIVPAHDKPYSGRFLTWLTLRTNATSLFRLAEGRGLARLPALTCLPAALSTLINRDSEGICGDGFWRRRGDPF